MNRILAFFIVLLCSQANAFWPNVTAKSWLVTDGNGNVLAYDNKSEVRPIASITKLMTVMVVLDAEQSLDEVIDKKTRRAHIQLALIKSDNESSKILCKYYPKGEHECHRAMNSKAFDLGMYSTKFHESTGLSIFNVSTAEDLVKLVTAASHYPVIVEDSKTAQVKIQINKKWFIFNNTNPIIGKRHNFIVSKTGYISASGGCIVMMLDTDIGRRIVIVLGSKNTRTRIPEAQFIAETY